MTPQNYKKIIFLLFAFGSLFFEHSFLYNKDGEILAQEGQQFVWECGDEIPIGEAIYETLGLINTIITNTDQMLARAGQQVTAANQIYDLDLPGACQAGNCETGCVTFDETISSETEVCGAPGEPCSSRAIPGTCRRDDPFGVPGPLSRWCWQETTSSTVTRCEVRPCTGNACPQDLMTEASSQVNLISSLSSLIAENRDAIYAAKARAPAVVEKLIRARGLLSNCATPASGYTEEEIVQLLQSLLTCEEAKYQRILTDEEESCFSSISRKSNFFCCRPRVP